MFGLAACGTSGGSSTGSSSPIVIGVLSVDQGPAAAGGADGYRGVNMALKKIGNKIGGHPIKIVKEGTDQTGPVALQKVRKLVEQEHAQIVIGPGSGDEGAAVANYSDRQPDVTFLDGIAAGENETVGHSNVFRFAYGNGAQWVAGLGTYAHDDMRVRSVATIGDNYSFGFAQVGGFVSEFCTAGGKVPKEIWTPLGATDYSSIVPQIPKDVDAVYVALNGADAINFLTAYYAQNGNAKFIGSSITIDQSVLSAKGSIKDHLAGVVSATPVADTIDTPDWKQFVTDYKQQFPDGFNSPSVWAAGYYSNAMAVLTALKQVDGDLGDRQAAFRKALQSMTLQSPTGPISLDENRNGIFTNYITKTAKTSTGDLQNQVVKAIPNVKESTFVTNGPATRTNPSCK
jgi:branched-chain amino acid transport system substrate-binding protein